MDSLAEDRDGHAGRIARRQRQEDAALDKDDNFLNLLNMSAAGIAPNLEKFDIKMRQVASGRYVGEFDIPRAGSYFLSVLPGPKPSFRRIKLPRAYISWLFLCL